MYKYIYWISLICMGISYLISILQTLSCVRNATNVRTIRYCSGSILMDSIRFTTFFILYYTRGFAELYDYLYYNIDLYLLIDITFVVIVVSIYFAPTFVYDLINGYVHKHCFRRILINMRNTIFSIIGVAILVLAYLLLVFTDKLIWGMIPFGFALLMVAVEAISGPLHDMKLITPKALIWLSIQGIIIIALGLLCFNLTQDPLFAYGMGIYKDSEAVNLFGLLILILPLVELLAFLERKFRPHLIIEMKHEVIIED